MQPTLSIIVPVYNEETTLKTIMDRTMQACPDAQIIYVDDGSADASLQICKNYAREQDIVIHKPNGGKGSAIREGLELAEGMYSIAQDADLEYDPKEILMLLREAQEKNADAVFGSRFLKKNPNIYKRFLMGNKVLTMILNILFFSHLTDSYTCYKLLKTDLFREIDMQAYGFELEAEICAKCLRRGIKIIEVPVSYNPRRLDEGKKICFADAWKGVMMMLKVRIGMY